MLDFNSLLMDSFGFFAAVVRISLKHIICIGAIIVAPILGIALVIFNLFMIRKKAQGFRYEIIIYSINPEDSNLNKALVSMYDEDKKRNGIVIQGTIFYNKTFEEEKDKYLIRYAKEHGTHKNYWAKDIIEQSNNEIKFINATDGTQIEKGEFILVEDITK